MSSSPSSNINNDLESKVDWDTFLTTIESKLRGPFSSLDLARAVTTTALRGTLTPCEYLQAIHRVWGRTDKINQLRILMGMLGLDAKNAPDTSHAIFQILRQAQQKSSTEEWVRVIAGLIQGIMFQEDDATEDLDSRRNSCRGEEANELLSKTCTEICERIEQEIAQEQHKAEDPSPDLNACFAPYRYTLVSKHLLEHIIPECHPGRNPHFKVNTEASILKMDQELEAQRAKEEREHQGTTVQKSTTKSPSQRNDDDENLKNLPPGFRPISKKRPAPGSSSGKTSSMFMPKKPAAAFMRSATRPGGVGGATRPGMTKPATATLLRTGKRKTKSELLNSTKLQDRIASRSGGKQDAESKIGGGRAMLAGARSKMKMMDVSEVASLQQEQTKRELLDSNSKVSKKRKLMELAKKKGLVKKMKTEEEPSPEAAALVKEEPTTDEPQAPSPAVPVAHVATEVPPTAIVPSQPQQGEEWRILLQERSNKLSSEDRVRVQQFFEAHYNPTPAQTVYKMKLHEQRTQDPNTGQPIKETFYLELDYSNFTSKQSKKVKRY